MEATTRSSKANKGLANFWNSGKIMSEHNSFMNNVMFANIASTNKSSPYLNYWCDFITAIILYCEEF